MMWLNVECSLVDGSTPVHLALTRLPRRILDPHGHVLRIATDTILEIGPPATTVPVLLQFFIVFDLLDGGCGGGFLPFLGFAEELLGGDLDGRRCAVLDARC